MAHKKAGGSTKNLRDSNPKFLGIKLSDGQLAKAGAIIVRQRGTPIIAGSNVRMGKDHTLYALKPGKVNFKIKRKIDFTGKARIVRVANVLLDSTLSQPAK